MNNPFYNRIVPAKENGVCWEVYCSNIRLNMLTSGCLKSDATGGMLGRTSTWWAVVVFLCQGMGLIEDWAAPVPQAPETKHVSEIFCSQEARVQVVLFTQWSTLVLQTLTNCEYYFLSSSWWRSFAWTVMEKRERAELFIDRSGTVKSLCVSQFFSAPGCDS